MKIDSSSGKAELSALTDRQNLKSPVSGKKILSTSVETAEFRQSELLSRSIESLLKMLKPTDKTHELLKGIINLIPRLPVGVDGLPANTNDSRLLLQVLKQFRLSRGDLLPEKIIKELKFAEKILELNQLKDEPVILFPELRTQGRPAIQINEERTAPGSEEDTNKLSLHFNMEILGSLSVVLSREGEKQNCLIHCSEKESRNKIRKAHTALLNQIKKRELRLDILKIQSRPASSKTEKETGRQKQNGFNLWG
jgi:hypothetical protein